MVQQAAAHPTPAQPAEDLKPRNKQQAAAVQNAHEPDAARDASRFASFKDLLHSPARFKEAAEQLTVKELKALQSYLAGEEAKAPAAARSTFQDARRELVLQLADRRDSQCARSAAASAQPTDLNGFTRKLLGLPPERQLALLRELPSDARIAVLDHLHQQRESARQMVSGQPDAENLLSLYPKPETILSERRAAMPSLEVEEIQAALSNPERLRGKVPLLASCVETTLERLAANRRGEGQVYDERHYGAILNDVHRLERTVKEAERITGPKTPAPLSLESFAEVERRTESLARAAAHYRSAAANHGESLVGSEVSRVLSHEAERAKQQADASRERQAARFEHLARSAERGGRIGLAINGWSRILNDPSVQASPERKAAALKELSRLARALPPKASAEDVQAVFEAAQLLKNSGESALSRSLDDYWQGKKEDYLAQGARQELLGSLSSSCLQGLAAKHPELDLRRPIEEQRQAEELKPLFDARVLRPAGNGQLIFDPSNIEHLPPESLTPENKKLRQVLAENGCESLLDPSRQTPLRIGSGERAQVYLPPSRHSSGKWELPVLSGSEYERIARREQLAVESLSKAGIHPALTESGIELRDAAGKRLERISLPELDESTRMALNAVIPGLGDPKRKDAIVCGSQVIEPPTAGEIVVRDKAEWQGIISSQLKQIQQEVAGFNQTIKENTGYLNIGSYRRAMNGSLLGEKLEDQPYMVKLKGHMNAVSQLRRNIRDVFGASSELSQELYKTEQQMHKSCMAMLGQQMTNVALVPAVAVPLAAAFPKAALIGLGVGAAYGVTRHHAQKADGAAPGGSAAEMMYDGALAGSTILPVFTGVGAIPRLGVWLAGTGAAALAAPTIVEDVKQKQWWTLATDAGFLAGTPLALRALQTRFGAIRAGGAEVKPAETPAGTPASGPRDIISFSEGLRLPAAGPRAAGAARRTPAPRENFVDTPPTRPAITGGVRTTPQAPAVRAEGGTRITAAAGPPRFDGTGALRLAPETAEPYQPARPQLRIFDPEATPVEGPQTISPAQPVPAAPDGAGANGRPLPPGTPGVIPGSGIGQSEREHDEEEDPNEALRRFYYGQNGAQQPGALPGAQPEAGRNELRAQGDTPQGEPPAASADKDPKKREEDLKQLFAKLREQGVGDLAKIFTPLPDEDDLFDDCPEMDPEAECNRAAALQQPFDPGWTTDEIVERYIGELQKLEPAGADRPADPARVASLRDRALGRDYILDLALDELWGTKVSEGKAQALEALLARIDAAGDRARVPRQFVGSPDVETYDGTTENAYYSLIRDVYLEHVRHGGYEMPADVSFAAAPSPEIHHGAHNGWLYRQVKAAPPSAETKERYSLNVKADPGLIRDLDQFICKHGSSYKVPDAPDGWTRSDTVTLYAHKPLSKEAQQELAQIAARYARPGDRLSGKPVLDEQGREITPAIKRETTPSLEDARSLHLEANRLDPLLGAAMGDWLHWHEKLTREYSISPGMVRAAQIVSEALRARDPAAKLRELVGPEADERIFRARKERGQAPREASAN